MSYALHVCSWKTGMSLQRDLYSFKSGTYYFGASLPRVNLIFKNLPNTLRKFSSSIGWFIKAKLYCNTNIKFYGVWSSIPRRSKSATYSMVGVGNSLLQNLTSWIKLAISATFWNLGSYNIILYQIAPLELSVGWSFNTSCGAKIIHLLSGSC